MANPNPSPETRFKRGQSGNRRGRPAGRSITAILRRMIQEPTADGRPYAAVLAERIVRQAAAGNFGFLKIALDRTEGKVTKRATLEPMDDGPEAEVRYADDEGEHRENVRQALEILSEMARPKGPPPGSEPAPAGMCEEPRS